MSCVNPNSIEFKLKTEKGLDPFSALVELSNEYAEMNIKQEESLFQKTKNDLVNMRDVHKFMNSERYTEELKQSLSENIDMFGELEAVYDYMKHGTIREVSMIMAPEVIDFEDVVSDMQTVEEIVNHSNQENALSFAKDLSLRMNVPYNVISISEFENRFPGKKASHNPAFYLNGEVYFVEGYFNSATVFHEFSHPFIKAIRIDNPELFLQLWNDFLNDPRSKSILENLRSEGELEESSFEFMQEAMVRVMEMEFESPKKTNFITQVLYNIKQFLRKLLGKKINISKLSVDTKLEDIVKMLSEGGEIVFNQNFVNEDDIVEFKTIYDEFVEPLKQMSKEKTQSFIDDYYKFLEDQIKNLKANTDTQRFIAEGLVSEDVTGILEQMRKTLSNLAYYVSGKENTNLKTLDENIQAEALEINNKLMSFGKMLSDVSVITNVFEKKLVSLQNATDKKSDEFFESTLSMQKYLSAWIQEYEKYSLSLPQEFRREDNSIVDNPIKVRINTQLSLMKSLKGQIDKLQNETVSEALYEHYMEFNTPIIESMKERLQYFLDNDLTGPYERMHMQLYGLSVNERNELRTLQLQSDLSEEEQDRVDALTQIEENAIALSKDAFIRIMSGQSKDANSLSGLFENYANSQDAVVSTFYMHLKNSYNEVAGNVNAIHNEFLNGLEPLLEKADFDNKILGEAALGKAIQQESIGVKYDHNNRVEEHKEAKFLNNYKNWEYPYYSLKEKVTKLKDNWLFTKKQEDKDKYLDAFEELDTFEENYMTREYKQEYYDANKLFRGTDGRKAKEVYDAVVKNLNNSNSQLLAEPANEDYVKAYIDAMNQYRDIKNLYDKNGNLKTGDDLTTAKIIKEYLERTKDFSDFIETPGRFEQAFEIFVQTLNKSIPDKTSQEYRDKMEEWIKNNTISSLSESYYEEREKLIARKKELLELVISNNQSFYDTTPLYDELNELLRVERDEFNVIDGSQMSRSKQKRIVELQERIAEIENNYIEPKTGATYGEVKKYKVLRFIASSGSRKLTKDEYDFMSDHEDYIRNNHGVQLTGLGPKALIELSEINEKLKALSLPVTTDSYIREFQSRIDILRTSNVDAYNKFKIFAEDYGYYLDNGDVLTDDFISQFIESIYDVKEMLASDKDFKEWFEANHYIEKDFIYYEDGHPISISDIYKKSAAWKTSQAIDPASYKVKSTMSLSGVLSEFENNGRLVINGKFVVPSHQYHHNKEKDSIKTEKIYFDEVKTIGGVETLVLANIDNRGKWLPKDYNPSQPDSAVSSKFIDEKYKAMFNENRDLWNLLDYIKRGQLKHEEGLNNSLKVYMAFPTIRTGKLEQYDRNYLRRKGLRASEVFNGAVDDFEMDYYTGNGANTGIQHLNQFNSFSRPISGNYKVPDIDVTRNIISSVLQRMDSIETYKWAKEKSSFAESLQTALKEAMVNPSILTFREQISTYRKLSDKEISKNKRLKQIERLIDNKIKGVQLFTEKLDDRQARIATTVLGTLQSGLARASFSFDLIKGMKNYVGGKSMMWKKTLDTDGYGVSDMLATRLKAGVTMGLMFKARLDNKEMPVELQLLSVMDTIPDMSKKNVSTFGSQTLVQDVAEGNFRYTARKYMSDSLPVHQMYALLHANKVMIRGKEIPLYDLVRLNNKGVVETIPGVPEEWKISYDSNGKLVLGSRIKDIMNEHNSLMNKNFGIASKFDEVDYTKTILGKMTMTMMKFFTGMAMDRYSVKFNKRTGVNMRRNLNQRRMEIGTISSVLLLVQEALDRKGKFYMLRSYSPQALAGFYQLVTAFVVQYLIRMMYSAIWFDSDDDGEDDFNFDPDKEGIFTQLKQTSTLPDHPLISDRYKFEGVGKHFNLENYSKLQFLNLLTGIEQEELTFNPIQAFKNTSNLALMKNALSEAGTYDAISDLLTWTTAPERKQIYNQNSGPYHWQQKSTHLNENKYGKVINILMKNAFGFDGSVLDPASAIQKRYNMSNR